MSARRIVAGPLLAAAVTLLVACGHQAGSGSSAAGWTDYRLYTHCGIIDANISGQWYRAVPPQADRQGNPPRGWGNPYQEGEIHVLSSTTTDYRDSAGHTVRFVLRPGATGPLQLCS